MFKVDIINNKLCIFLNDTMLIEFNSGDLYLDLHDCFRFLSETTATIFRGFNVVMNDKDILLYIPDIEIKTYEFIKGFDGKIINTDISTNRFIWAENVYNFFIKKEFNYLDHLTYIFNNKEKREKVLCAAIHVIDNKIHNHPLKNISTGFVISGFRHHNCFALYDTKNSPHKVIQGFLTSKGRFVNRMEAKVIAFTSEQIEDYGLVTELYSEDLY